MKDAARTGLAWICGLAVAVVLLLITAAPSPPSTWPASPWMGTNIFPISNQAQFVSLMNSWGVGNAGDEAIGSALTNYVINWVPPVAKSLSWRDSGIFSYVTWQFVQGANGSLPDAWLICTESNVVSSVFQFTPEGAIEDYAGFSDNGGGAYLQR